MAANAVIAALRRNFALVKRANMVTCVRKNKWRSGMEPPEARMFYAAIG